MKILKMIYKFIANLGMIVMLIPFPIFLFIVSPLIYLLDDSKKGE